MTSFESSFGELGGCPVPKGATGNIATEDLISMLHEMGEETGVDLQALIQARFAVALHERSVGKLLHRLGFARLSVRPQHPESDSEAQVVYKKLRCSGAPSAT